MKSPTGQIQGASLPGNTAEEEIILPWAHIKDNFGSVPRSLPWHTYQGQPRWIRRADGWTHGFLIRNSEITFKSIFIAYFHNSESESTVPPLPPLQGSVVCWLDSVAILLGFAFQILWLQEHHHLSFTPTSSSGTEKNTPVLVLK
jgi:hypothetical protein